MNKHLTAIITALFIGTNINAAGGDVVLPAAIPVYVERFDWALGSGGNDGNWASKYMNTARSTWENMTLSSCTEANTCICVGTTSYEGKITLTDMPKTEGFVTMRAGSFLNEDRDKAKIVLENIVTSPITTTIDTEKFSYIRKAFYDTKSDRTIIIKGDDSKYNYRFYFDDLVVYSVTTDIEKLKTASRILLATEPYSKEQIQILQQVVKENKNLTSIDLWSIESVEEPFELQPANPNCIIYDPNHNVTNTVNVARCSGTKKDVNTYVCENLVIKDGYPFDAIYSFTATNVSYDREFANTGEDYFSTVCLPFAIDKDNPQIAKLLKFVELKQEDNQIIFDDASVIFLGDAEESNGEALIALYGKNLLSCKYLQGAHHLINDDRSIYANIRAEKLLAPQGRFTVMTRFCDNIRYLTSLFGAENIYFAGDCTYVFTIKDGNESISYFESKGYVYDDSGY